MQVICVLSFPSLLHPSLCSSHLPHFRCNLTSNFALHGGAIKGLNASNLVATDCIFRTNIAKKSGGASDLSYSTADFQNCEFDRNIAYDGEASTDELGGAMHVSGAAAKLSVRLRHCSFWKNHATYGGGMSLGSAASVRIDEGKFLNNTAKKIGGAIRIGPLSRNSPGAYAEFAGTSLAPKSAPLPRLHGATVVFAKNITVHSLSSLSSCREGLKWRGRADLLDCQGLA